MNKGCPSVSDRQMCITPLTYVADVGNRMFQLSVEFFIVFVEQLRMRVHVIQVGVCQAFGQQRVTTIANGFHHADSEKVMDGCHGEDIRAPEQRDIIVVALKAFGDDMFPEGFYPFAVGLLRFCIYLAYQSQIECNVIRLQTLQCLEEIHRILVVLKTVIPKDQWFTDPVGSFGAERYIDADRYICVDRSVDTYRQDVGFRL